MAMETNTTGLVISPIPQVKPITQEPITQKVGDTGARSPFQQQTNVNINNSVEDMAGILAKVASTETMAENQLPQELQKMIQTMMQNSFSLDATLAQGVGSSLESQRFTLEQLNTLSRMLTQLGTMAEQGSTAPLSDSLQTLLSSLKTLDGADGKILNPVNLNKLAFQLLDSKEFSSLDPQLQQLLTSAAGMLNSSAVPAGQTSGTMTALKQLMQFFMPTPGGIRSRHRCREILPSRSSQGADKMPQPLAAGLRREHRRRRRIRVAGQLHYRSPEWGSLCLIPQREKCLRDKCSHLTCRPIRRGQAKTVLRSCRRMPRKCKIRQADRLGRR